MSRLSFTKTTFSAGEVSTEILGRHDLKSYGNGARRLRNVVIRPTGGVTRRPGLRHVANAQGAGRLIAFAFNTEQTYLLAFSDLRMDVYKDGVHQTNVAMPWTAAQLSSIRWTQSADTLLITHPDVPPKQITRTADDAWTITDWSYYTDKDIIYQPYHKFADVAVTLQPSATTGNITVTASADVFVAAHVNTRFRIQNKEILITAVASGTSASATVKDTALVDTQATKDWEEQALSAVRGWPSSVTFHQDRMVIGGSRDQPNRLWLSKSSDLFNFDLGTGLDDEAIEFQILSDQVNAIACCFSGRHLQVLTSGAEWMVAGDPLTPTNIQVKRQTRVGSPIDRFVPPRDIDGATIYVSANGRELREFIFADLSQVYDSNDLALASRHLINAPVDMDYASADRLLYVVMGDGTLATITNYRAEVVTAWTAHATQGTFSSVAVVNETVYVLVTRDGTERIEQFDGTICTDACITATTAPAIDVWSGLDHLEGQTVQVVGDDSVIVDQVVTGGQITLPYAVSKVEIGLAYTHEIEPLPVVSEGARSSSIGLPIRLVRATFRLKDTAALYIDTGRGVQSVPFKSLPDAVLDAPPPQWTGDVSVRGIGWRRLELGPLWRIEQDSPLPCVILSVTTEVKVNA